MFPSVRDTLMRSSRHRFDGPAKFMAMSGDSEHGRGPRDGVPLTDRDWPIAEWRLPGTQYAEAATASATRIGSFRIDTPERDDLLEETRRVLHASRSGCVSARE